MKKSMFAFGLALAAAVTVFPLTLSAESSQEIRARMKSRRAALESLSASGIAGEANTGYLAVVPGKKASAEQEKLISDENADRKKVYTAISRKENTTADFVGKRRAVKLRTMLKPGESWQDDSGAWKKK